MTEHTTSIDHAVRMSHRHLMGALMLVMTLGLAAVLSLTMAGGRADRILWTVLPVLITIIAASLQRMNKRIDARALKAVRDDELRQASLARAWRNGFLAVLFLQPVLALGLTWSGAAHGVALMAAGAVCIGTATMLTTLLWYDR